VVITCDCYSATSASSKAGPQGDLQLCFAHLFRDFRFCEQYETNDADVCRYVDTDERLSGRLVKAFKRLKELLKADEGGSHRAALLRKRLARLKERLTDRALDAPEACGKALAFPRRAEKPIVLAVDLWYYDYDIRIVGLALYQNDFRD
jgi:hypothetical protein